MQTTQRWIRWPAGTYNHTPTQGRNGPIAFGGDYNPEQWPEDVWQEDVRLMQEAGVNLVTVGVFSWARLQPTPDTWDFDWLDRVLDLLHEHGIAVDLATATASPPAWLTTAHPEMLPVDRLGTVLHQGGRQAWSPSSAVYREHSLRLVEKMAERYGSHPALSMWHVSNELGCHNGRCYSELSAQGFRAGGCASGTPIWTRSTAPGRPTSGASTTAPGRRSSRRGSPRRSRTPRSSWISRGSPPMRCATSSGRRWRCCGATPRMSRSRPTSWSWAGHFKEVDYRTWVDDLDLVSNDHYMMAHDPEAHVELAFSADHTRGLAGGQPWMLIESSTSAVSWQPVNTAKPVSQLRRNSLTHVARGADAVCFFQWRASAAGAEKYHSAMLPHAGTDSELWRSVVELGADLQRLAEISGSTVESSVAIIVDYENWWAAELDAHPSSLLAYRRTAEGWYRSLWDANIPVDIVPRGADLTGYRVVLAPMLYLVRDADVAALDSFTRAGGQVLVTYFSGIADENDHIRLGGYPGAFRDLLGVRSDEFRPLLGEQQVALEGASLGALTGTLWSEPVVPTDAIVLATYTDGPSAGFAAITRAARDAGHAWYVSTELDTNGRRAVIDLVCAAGGVTAPVPASPGIEVVVRRAADVEYVFAINHTDTEGWVNAEGTDLLTGRLHAAPVPVPENGVVVLRRQPSTSEVLS